MTAPSREDSLIARYFKPLATHPGARGLVDDAAVLAASDSDLVITTDAIVEGVHFLPDDPPDTLARKALRVNLSDLAAKGATPAGFVLTLALHEASDDFLAPFARALGEDATLFDCPLLGGDTVGTPGLMMISVTAFGHVPKGKAVSRVGAQIGDHVFVSGTIGDATLGLAVGQGRLDVIDDAHRAHLIDRYRVPQPRVQLAFAVREHASAAMDVSDGLAGDLAKLCAASRVSARIASDRIPLSEVTRAAVASDAVDLPQLLSGGDDYEILCTVPEHHIAAFLNASGEAGGIFTAIGVITAGTDTPALIGDDGTMLSFDVPSYSHF